MENPSAAARVFEIGQGITDQTDGVFYRAVRFLGQGSMGEVYEVARGDTGQRFAMKCLRAHLARDATVLQRAWFEAAALRDLRHPNVVPVHAVGVRPDGMIWMTMDLLVGYTLRQLLGELARVPIPWALRMLRDAALGLSAVHEVAVHRDVKPENVHLGRDGQVRLLDLGAGKFHHLGLTKTGHRTIGTVPYMSPEQIQKPDAIDGRSDVFSVGVVLFELLTGKHPFAAAGVDQANVYQLVVAIVSAPPTPLAGVAPWVPSHVADLVARCLEKDRERRFESAAALAEALGAALDQTERTTGPAPPLTTLTEALHRLELVQGDAVTGEESTALEPGAR
jgi:serine/threonine protein kinase